jgi:hypothetical protein
MKQTLIHQPNLSITRATGAEGPHHDPYHFEEFTVQRHGNTVTSHLGLAEWIKFKSHGEKKYRIAEHMDGRAMEEVFRALTGFTASEWQSFLRKLEKAKAKVHRYHDVQNVSGYPGEHFVYCRTCDAVLDSWFNESAVI